MLWLKACPRCRGDLYQERDIYGSFRSCLQCGYAQEIEVVRRKPVVVSRAVEKVLVRRHVA